MAENNQGANTVVNGRGVLIDPGLAQLRRYLPVLAVVAAPYAGFGGNDDPVSPLDPVAEWRQLTDLVVDVTRAAGSDGVPLAFVRLDPPTAPRLRAALAAAAPVPGGADAYRVVHIVAQGERDMVFLEDDEGSEAYTVSEHLVRLFGPSGARLVVLDGSFSRRVAEMLIDETPVEVVIGTRRRVNPANAHAFNLRLYTELVSGATVRSAFRAALAAMEAQADRYELVTADDQDVRLTLPPPDDRASRPLVDAGTPRQIGVPVHAGFVGRREELQWIADVIMRPDRSVLAVTGEPGVGKTWLAATFARRFGWCFPDGVIWFVADPLTTADEVCGRLAHLLELPPSSQADAVLAVMASRRVLAIIDGVDALPEAQADALAVFLGGLDTRAGSRILLTAVDLPDSLARLAGPPNLPLAQFAPLDARTLAMRLAVERDLDVLDVDTIDDFLEQTLALPWLIARGIELVGAGGIDRALDELATLEIGRAGAMVAFVVRRLDRLALRPQNAMLALLRAVGDLPAAFDVGLARVFVGDQAPKVVAGLAKAGLVDRQGDLLAVPASVRALLQEWAPLELPELLRRDARLIDYLGRSWQQDGSAESGRLTGVQRARLNQTRGAMQRQVDGEATFDPAIMSRLLVLAGPAFWHSGLAAEFLDYAEAMRARLNAPRDLARLHVAMGDMLGKLPGRGNDAGWLFQVTLALEDLDHRSLADATCAYGKYLVQVGQAGTAQHVLGHTLRTLLEAEQPDYALAAQVAHAWANTLVELGRYRDAVPRFEAALTSYSRSDQLAQAIWVQLDLAPALVALGEFDRAEDLLRQANATAATVDLPGVIGPIQRQMAETAARRAESARQAGDRDLSRTEWSNAVRYLGVALEHALPQEDAASLAELYQAYGRAQARLGLLDDAAANVVRSRTLFARTGAGRELAEAGIALGQIRLAQGDSVAAQALLHEALDQATALHNQTLMSQAGSVLVRLHQFRARHARQSGDSFRLNVLDQASYSEAHLAALGLDEHAAALGTLVRALTGRA